MFLWISLLIYIQRNNNMSYDDWRVGSKKTHRFSAVRIIYLFLIMDIHFLLPCRLSVLVFRTQICCRIFKCLICRSFRIQLFRESVKAHDLLKIKYLSCTSCLSDLSLVVMIQRSWNTLIMLKTVLVGVFGSYTVLFSSSSMLLSSWFVICPYLD